MVDDDITKKAITYYINRLNGIRRAKKENKYHRVNTSLINKAIKDIKGGMSKCATARKYGISRQTIYRYIKNSKEAIQR